MNTGPFLLPQLLSDLEVLEHIHQAPFSKHGDLCCSGGFKADTLNTSAENHDPMHDPYGICWSMAQVSATEQPLSFSSAQTEDESATQQRAASSSGCATEQPLQTQPPHPAPSTQHPAAVKFGATPNQTLIEIREDPYRGNSDWGI